MRVVKPTAAIVAAIVVSAVAAGSASAAETLWRWLPGAPLTVITGTSGKATYQVKGGLSITCPKSTTTGEVTEGQTLLLYLRSRTTCTTAGLPVNSLGDASGIILEHWEIHNCLIAPGHRGALYKLLTLHMEVPSTKLLIVASGSYIALVPGGKGKTFNLTVEQKEGVQAIEKCAGGAGDALVTSDDGGAFVQTGLEEKESSITFTSVEQEAMES